MTKQEMFELLKEIQQKGISNRIDLEYTSLRIEGLEKKFEKVDKKCWNETMEKHGENKIIGSAIDYVFDGIELSAAAEREYKDQIDNSIKVKAKIESRKDFESHRAYWQAKYK